MLKIKPIYYAMILITGFTYLSGYLVNTIFLRSIGIESNALLKAQHIETGAVFIFYTSLTILGSYAFSLIRAIREEKKVDIIKALNMAIRGDKNIIKTLISTFVLLIFVVVMLFVALFTKYDWDIVVIFGRTIKFVFGFYILFISFGLLIMRYFTENEQKKLSDVIRYLLLLITIGFGYMLYRKISWSHHILNLLRN